MNPTATPPPAPDAPLLTPKQAEAVVRIVEASPHVRRRYQFFVWTQSQVQTLLPHEILVCGAYQRQRRELDFEVFNSVVFAPELLQALTDGRGALLRMLVGAWIEARGRPLLLPVARLASAPGGEALTLPARAGIATLLVHGHARPQRPSELESLFVFASSAAAGGAQAATHVEILLPHLHTAWLRVTAAEREIAPPLLPPPRRAADAAHALRVVTDREAQILGWMRQGKSNQQIAEVLGISPLTVKNHVQKILRKLGASNRAQAVAEAIARGLLDARGA